MQALAAAGIAGAAGLNAPLTILLVAVLARADQIDLFEGADFIASFVVIAIAAAWLLVEIIVDKLPGADSVNDVIQSPIRPLVGAGLFAAVENPVSEANVILAAALGLAIAALVHWLKSTIRRLITETTGGHLNALVSAAEDGAVIVLIFAAAYVPPLAAAILLLMTVPAALFVVRRPRPRMARR